MTILQLPNRLQWTTRLSTDHGLMNGKRARKAILSLSLISHFKTFWNLRARSPDKDKLSMGNSTLTETEQIMEKTCFNPAQQENNTVFITIQT